MTKMPFGILSVLVFSMIQALAYPQAIQRYNIELQNGDLLFVGAKSENLSGAINRVTQKETSKAVIGR